MDAVDREQQATQVAPASATGRPLRADARRNRDRLLDVAGKAFAAYGVEASLEEIARRAGVGVGTLYRHFPNRDVLIEAVYRHEVEQLCEAAADYQRRLPADEALATWMQRFVRYIATKRGLASALKAIVGQDSELFTDTRERIRAAAGMLLDAASEAGAVRADVSSADLVKAMSGICLAYDQSDFDDQATRLVGLLMDGLRFGAPGTPPYP